MWANGSDFFVQLPSESNARILHGGTVAGVEDGVVRFKANDRLELEPGQDIRIYFERQREFMQQPATIEAVLDEGGSCIFAIRPEGEPVSAENRQCYRVSTIFANLSIELAGETCSLTDVSVQGFSLISTKPYKQGQTLPIRLLHEGKVYEGNAQVQSIKDLGGKTRYGLLCAGKASGPASLPKGLQQVSMSIQRMQLRRRAGA